MALEIDARNRPFSHAQIGPAVARDQSPKELEQIGIVANGEHAFPVGVFREQVQKRSIVTRETECRADFHLRVITEFCSHELCRLQGAFQGAGDDQVDLHIERGQHTSHQHALVFAFLDQAAFVVKQGISANQTGIRVTHKVKIH